MVKCPYCNKDIDCLVNRRSGVATYEFDGNGYWFLVFEADGDCNSWECPNCRKELFDNGEDAIKFLKGGE
jgi:hypothetical protein